MHGYAFEPPSLQLLEPELPLEIDGLSLSATEPTEGESPEIVLEPDEETTLVQDVLGIIHAYDQAMIGRFATQKEIEEAYDLVADPKRAGTQAGASMLASEMTRDHVNQCYARIANQIMFSRPLVQCQVGGDDAGDQPTAERLAEGKSIGRLFESYNRVMGADRIIPMSIFRATKVGMAWVRVLWEEESRKYRLRDRAGVGKWARRKRGNVKWRSIRNQDMVAWPLDVADSQDCLCLGHRFWLTPAEFRQWALSNNIDPELTRQVLDAPRGERTEGSVGDDLQRRDIEARSLNPTDGEIMLTDLWLDLPLPASYHERTGTEPGPFRLILHEDMQRALLVSWNPLDCQKMPYFPIPYWIEDGCLLASGVGHEVRGNQQQASSLLNLLMDNLRVVCNWLVLVKEGTTAETNQTRIAPGARIVVDDIDDIKAVQLGGELTRIHEAIGENQQRARRNSGMSDINSGRGDATMKSGATASGIQTLATEGGKKFARIDENVREALSRIYQFCLLLLQQYAPTGLWVEHVGDEDAAVLQRIQFIPPTGDLENLFRLRVNAPGAASNQDAQRQNVMLLVGLIEQFTGGLIQLASTAWAQTRPAGILQLMEQAMQFKADFFKRVLELHDVVGLKPPHPGAPTPMEEMANQAMLQAQQLQQQLEQMQAEMQAAQQENQMLQQAVAMGAHAEVQAA